MSYLDLYEKSDDGGPFSELPERAEVLTRIRARKAFDILIIGGGIHGAAFARLAAFNGFSTVLFDRSDYAFETSSRSSKMVHGGLRYLELFDFQQVLEGVKAREELFRIAGHLAAPHPFLIPVKRGAWFDRLKFHVGLTVYDLFLRARDRRHRWRSFSGLGDSPWGGRKDLAGAFEYTDGVMDDARLVMEMILSARQEGAECLNYVSVERVGARETGEMRVFCRDVLSGDPFDVKAGVVINCAGPWVAQIGRAYEAPAPLQGGLKFSRGVHILFDKPWPYPALFLPLEGKARYYFVWPHFGGTLVGTTEREVAAPESDPQPTRDELDEIFARLERDLPQSGLNRSSAFHAFAGVRTLPLRSGAANTSKLSRRHIWTYTRGMLTLLGGKFTTAAWTVVEGLRTAVQLADLKLSVTPLTDRLLPGASGASAEECAAIFENRGIPPHVAAAARRRLGTRVRFLPEFERWSEVLGGVVLRGEVELMLRTEQVETLDDLMRRRLGLELTPNYGLAALDEITALFKARRPGCDVDEQAAAYRRKVAAFGALFERGAGEAPPVSRSVG